MSRLICWVLGHKTVWIRKTSDGPYRVCTRCHGLVPR